MNTNFDLGPIFYDGCLDGVFVNDSGNLKIAHINAQSICPSYRSSKLDELQSILSNRSLDILCITESWLDTNVLDPAVAIPGYTLCRSDRLSGARGGGVAIYIAENIRHKCVFRCTEYGCCEGLFLEIPLENDTLLVGVVYLPRGDLDGFDRSLSDLIVRYTNIILVGDFNNNLYDIAKSHSVHMLCGRLALKCHHIFTPTHFDSYHGSASLIDYFLLSQNIQVHTAAQFQLPFVSHHSLICVSVILNIPHSQQVDYFRDYINIDRVGMDSYFSNLDFSPLYLTGDADEMCSFFTTVFNDLMCYVPLRRVSRFGRQRSLRFSNQVNYYRSLTSIALRDFYNDRCAAKWEIYRLLRNRTKSLIRNLKLNHGRRVFEGCSTRQMWNILRGVGVLAGPSSVVGLDVNELNNHFVSNQLGSFDDFPDFTDNENTSNGFSFANVTEAELYYSLFRIKSTSIGSDGLSIKLLKIAYPYISRHLLHLVNTILTTSKFPSQWKISRIIPVSKLKGSTLVCNMRPISILPSISKVVENVLNAQMVNYFNNNRLFSSCQYGFRTGHNTNFLLTELTESVRIGLNCGNICILVSIDLSKAFDQVKHSGLVNKLFTKYNFSNSACNLVWSYLSDRKQYVTLNGLSSDLEFVRSGVPQGSVLGPLLFSIFLNDFFEYMQTCECKVLAFADDIQLLWTSSCVDYRVLESTVNNGLTLVNDWMVGNHLHVNPEKTKAMIFRSSRYEGVCLNLMICNNQIEIVNSLKCLGVTIDDRLSFEPHINNISGSVINTLRRLYRLNLCFPLHVRKSVVNALIMSRINYGLEVYSGCNLGNLGRIESLVRKAVRFVFGINIRVHVSGYVTQLLNFTFEDYLKFRLLIYLFKIIKFQTPLNLVRMFSFIRSLRNPQIFIPRIYNRTYELSFSVRVARLWNNLPRLLRSFSFTVAMFKCKISHVFNNSF